MHRIGKITPTHTHTHTHAHTNIRIARNNSFCGHMVVRIQGLSIYSLFSSVVRNIVFYRDVTYKICRLILMMVFDGMSYFIYNAYG